MNNPNENPKWAELSERTQIPVERIQNAMVSSDEWRKIIEVAESMQVEVVDRLNLK